MGPEDLGLYMGSKVFVVINGYTLMKETFVKRGKDFSDRPVTIVDLVTGQSNVGIITSSGDLWKEQRSVTIQLLRSFGLGNNILANRIQEEVTHYLIHLSELDGQPIDIALDTKASTSNIVCSIVFGQRFGYQDDEFKKLISSIHNYFSNLSFGGLISFVPALRHLPGDILKIKQMKKDIDEMFDLIRSLVARNQNDKMAENFITEYLAERERRVQKGEATTMDDINLVRVIFDLLTAGTETVATTVSWFVLYMLHYPDVQKKIFHEILENVGTERAPTEQDKAKFNYLNATIMETQRLASIAPNSFLHTCPRDVTIRGYTIPKGTYISPYLDSILHDEKIWGNDVMSFRPERFLDQDGKVQTPEEFIPFSIGKRACPGEGMAKTEMFLYLSNVIQGFQLLPADPKHLPTLKCIFGLTVIPEPYQVRFVERNK
ncbi:Cytochrome P450 2C3 [Bulinus truncatus]|nr:Cytochrome P450 2C3 [Bulinus truncatus]